MSMYSISGLNGSCDCGCGAVDIVARPTKRGARKLKRKERRTARKTGINCKGSRAKAIL